MIGNTRTTLSFSILMGLSLLVSLVARGDDDIRARVESARVEYAKNAEKVREDSARRLKELEGRLAEVKQWTRAQFELGERDVIDKPTVLNPTLIRWQKEREATLYRLLQFKDKSGGAIESGRALNILLARIGSAAHENCQTRKINPAAALPLFEPTANEKIDQDLLRRLSYQENTLGSKISGKFNQDPLDLDWPPILREPMWDSYRTTLAEVRDELLTELKSGNGVLPATDVRIREAIASLNAAFAKYRREWTQKAAKSDGDWALEYRRITEGQKHIDKLISSVYAIVEASSLNDVLPATMFDGGNIEDFLSYMHSNNLQFAPPSNAVDRKAYFRVFDMMVRYYLDINSAVKAEEHLNQEIVQLKKINRESTEVATGQKMSAMDQAAVMIEEMKFIRTLLNDD